MNSCDEVRETALHKAAKNGHVVVCHVLIKRDARHDIKNQSGKTALDLATENKHIECVEYLHDPGYVSTCVFLHLHTNFEFSRVVVVSTNTTQDTTWLGYLKQLVLGSSLASNTASIP